MKNVTFNLGPLRTAAQQLLSQTVFVALSLSFSQSLLFPDPHHRQSVLAPPPPTPHYTHTPRPKVSLWVMLIGTLIPPYPSFHHTPTYTHTHTQKLHNFPLSLSLVWLLFFPASRKFTVDLVLAVVVMGGGCGRGLGCGGWG